MKGRVRKQEAAELQSRHNKVSGEAGMKFKSMYCQSELTHGLTQLGFVPPAHLITKYRLSPEGQQPGLAALCSQGRSQTS